MQNKQHILWLLAALTAPLAHFTGSGWLMAGATAIVILPLSLLPKRWGGMGKPFALVQLLWIGVVAGALLQNSAVYWPSDNNLVVPLTILGLAIFTNRDASPRIGAVAAFCMALLAIPAAISGAAHIDLPLLSPTIGPWPWTMTLALLLPNLPASGTEKKGRGLLYGGTLTVTLSILVQGVLSQSVAASVRDPFYQTARTLGHLEPIIAAGMTLGWYALVIYGLHSARIIASEAGIREVWADVLVAGTAAVAILLGVQPVQPIWPLLSTFLWVFIPFLNKNRNVEKI